MLFLGIDPGTTRVGYGEVQRTRTGVLILQRHGVIKSGKRYYMDRLEEILKKLIDVLSHPVKSYDALCMEWGYVDTWHKKNYMAVIKLSEARGYLTGGLRHMATDLIVRQPTAIRASIGFKGGKAGKDLVAKQCSSLIRGRPKIQAGDEGDAVACAISAALKGG